MLLCVNAPLFGATGNGKPKRGKFRVFEDCMR